MKFPSTTNILSIAAIGFGIVFLVWYFFFHKTSNREGFQATTAEAVSQTEINGIVKQFMNSGFDKDRMCPMIEVQFNTLNQQLEVFKQKENQPMVTKLTDMLLNIKNAHEVMKCDEPTLSPDGSSEDTQ